MGGYDTPKNYIKFDMYTLINSGLICNDLKYSNLAQVIFGPDGRKPKNIYYIFIFCRKQKKTTTVRLYESFHAILHAIISSQCKLRMKGVRIV